MESEHTPGPWKVANNGKRGKKSATFRIWRNDPDNLPDDHDDFRNNGYACIAPHVHGEANARLIEAAPDMLAALEDVVARITEAFPAMAENEPVKRARAAIAKAKGE